MRAGGWFGRSVLAVAMFAGAGAQAQSWHFVTEQFAPYTQQTSDGQAAGPMADVLHRLCAQLKIACRIEVLPWRRALAAAERGEVDGIFTVVDTPERRAAFHLADPVVEARYVFYTQASNTRFMYAAPRDLRGRSIGVYGPSASSITLAGLTRGTDAQVVVEVDNAAVLRKLAAGRYGDDGLALINEMVAEDLIARTPVTGLRQAGEASRFSYTFGFSRNRPSFDAAQFARFNKALGALCRSGELQALLDRYRMRAPACRG